jgi:hypothetical protein
MKPTLLSLAFALVSPFAFAQTTPSNGETENPVSAKTTEEFSNGETENPVSAKTTEEFSNGETENPVSAKTEVAITTTDGFVSAYAPDEMIAVITAGGEAMSFVIGPAARYQDRAGNDVDASAVKEGSTVQVTAEENGDQRVVRRIVVDS